MQWHKLSHNLIVRRPRTRLEIDPEMKFPDCQESVTEQRGWPRVPSPDKWHSDIDTVIRWHVSVSGWQGAATRWQGQIRNTDWCLRPLWLSRGPITDYQLRCPVSGSITGFELITWVFTALRALRILSPYLPCAADVASYLFVRDISLNWDVKCPAKTKLLTELLTIKFRVPDVTEIGASLQRCQCWAQASSHVTR